MIFCPLTGTRKQAIRKIYGRNEDGITTNACVCVFICDNCQCSNSFRSSVGFPSISRVPAEWPSQSVLFRLVTPSFHMSFLSHSHCTLLSKSLLKCCVCLNLVVRCRSSWLYARNITENVRKACKRLVKRPFLLGLNLLSGIFCQVAI